MLNDFGEQVLERATPDIQRNAISTEITKSLKWYRQLPTGIFSAIAYSALLLGVAFILRFAGIDLLSILTAVGRP